MANGTATGAAGAGAGAGHWGQRGTAAATIAAGLTYENVRRRYDDRLALAGVSLEVAPGEIVCMLGPSGCGKTTLLRITAGIEKPSGGRVLINGLEVAGPAQFVPPERRNVGLMFQDFALFPHLTILQNVAFGLWSLSRTESDRIAVSTLERVGLAHLAESYPHTLSGGEQQRVALARAIAPRPGVLLMDEPFSGLDVMLRQSMQEETLALLRETRATSLIVTHDPEEAMRLADRIVVMRAGLIVQVGSAESLYRAPAALFVARLFSDINEVPAVVAAGRLATPLGSLPARGLADGTKAILCVRQRAIGLGPAGSGVPARVLGVKFLGDAAVVELAVADIEDPLRARTPGPVAFARGEEVGLQVDPATLLGFTADGANTL